MIISGTKVTWKHMSGDVPSKATIGSGTLGQHPVVGNPLVIIGATGIKSGNIISVEEVKDGLYVTTESASFHLKAVK